MKLLSVFVLLASRSHAWISASNTFDSPVFLRERSSRSRDMSLKAVGSVAEIIGGGRIGALLEEAGCCRVLKRDDSISAEESGPIIICTRNDALDGIVDDCPEHRREDLVFVQNGYLDDFLESKGLLDNTQVLLYLSKASMEAPAVDGVTSTNPEGLTAATGKHAEAFADRLAALKLKCKVITSDEYRPAMFEKLM